MATKLHGMLNLSRIPKELITTNSKGESVIWVDVLHNDEADKYGNTDVITTYDKNAKKAIYLANLAPQEFQAKAGKASVDSKSDDLPF